jgi:hypothetical protein
MGADWEDFHRSEREIRLGGRGTDEKAGSI